MAILPQSIDLISTTVAFKNPFSITGRHDGLVIPSLDFFFPPPNHKYKKGKRQK